MKPVRALGLRLLGPREHAESREVPDLTTRAGRESGGLPPDALAIAPPRPHWTPVPAPVPGLLMDGNLPGDPEARFVLRVPRAWNGGVAVAGSPGLTSERALDLYWSDFLLSRGWAFACTDKGVRLSVDGDRAFVLQGPENGIVHWYPRLKALARLARSEAARCHGRPAAACAAVGVSNGGYLARRAAEDPEEGLFDAGVDVSGVLWTAEGPSLMDELEASLRRRPAAQAPWDAVLGYYASFYWEATLEYFRNDLGADRSALSAIALTGDLKRPLRSIAGRRDYLVPCARHAEGYAALVRGRGKSALHSLELVDDATHCDGDGAVFPFAKPLMPAAHAAFLELEGRLLKAAA